MKTETACSLHALVATTHTDGFVITTQEDIIAIIQSSAEIRAATKHIPCILITGGLTTPIGSLSMAALKCNPTYKIEKTHWALGQSWISYNKGTSLPLVALVPALDQFRSS